MYKASLDPFLYLCQFSVFHLFTFFLGIHLNNIIPSVFFFVSHRVLNLSFVDSACFCFVCSCHITVTSKECRIKVSKRGRGREIERRREREYLINVSGNVPGQSKGLQTNIKRNLCVCLHSEAIKFHITCTDLCDINSNISAATVQLFDVGLKKTHIHAYQ